MSSFSEKYISPRGFNQMKNDRVRCLTSKRSKRMIWIAQTFTIWSPRGSKIQKIKGARHESNGFLKCLECFQDPRSKMKGARHWIQRLPEMLEMPSGVPTDPRTNWRLKANFLWTPWLSCFEVCNCLSATRWLSRPEKMAYVKESQKLASKLWKPGNCTMNCRFIAKHEQNFPNQPWLARPVDTHKEI